MCAILCTTQNIQLLSDQEGKNLLLPPLLPDQGANFLTQYLKANPDHNSRGQSTAAKAASRLLGGLPLYLSVVADLLSGWQCSVVVFVENYENFCRALYTAKESISFDDQLRHGPLQDVSHVFDYALQKLSAKGHEIIGILAMLDGMEIAGSLIFSQHKDDTLDFLRPKPVFWYV